MREQRFFQFLAILGTSLFILGVCLFFKNGAPPVASTDPFSSGLLVQNNYMGPIKKIPGNPQLVRIEVLVRDSPALAGVQIQSATFDEQKIPLKPRDIHGNRGSASFQKAPGKYTLRWVVHRDKVVWPRTASHEEIVMVDPRDLWVQISIVGEEASIR